MIHRARIIGNILVNDSRKYVVIKHRNIMFMVAEPNTEIMHLIYPHSKLIEFQKLTAWFDNSIFKIEIYKVISE